MKEEYFLKFVASHSIPEYINDELTNAFCIHVRCTNCAINSECNEAIKKGDDFIANMTAEKLKYYKEKYIEFFI